MNVKAAFRGDPAKTPRVGKRPHHDFCLTDMNT